MLRASPYKVDPAVRLLLACEFYYPSVGGVQEVMRQLAERFVKAGHEVTVATTYMPERKSRQLNGVRLEEFRISGNLVRGMKGEVSRYQNYLLEHEYDLLMVKAAQQWTFDALTTVLDLVKKPKIFVPCGFSSFYDAAYANYFRRMPDWLRKFDRLVFYATDYRDINFARNSGIDNVEILSNGADEREFGVPRDKNFRKLHGIPDDAFVVLTVGSLTGLKGHHELAQAFEKCDFDKRPAFLILNGNVPRPEVPEKRRPRWRLGLVKVGAWIEHAATLYERDGPVRLAKWLVRGILERIHLDWLLVLLGYPGKQPSLPAEPAEASVFDVVRRINAMPGRRAVVVDLPRAQLVQAYLNSDLFVFVSKVEYSPLVLFEAAAAGLPFLSVPVGNAAEIAEWTGAGVICPARFDAQGYTQVNVAELADAICRLSREPERLARLGANGRKNWQERFTWDTISRQYERLFERCLQMHGVKA